MEQLIKQTKNQFLREFCRKEMPQGLAEYRNERWGSALRLFQKCLTIIPDDSPSKVFIERCQEYIESPPTTWDGVYQVSSK